MRPSVPPLTAYRSAVTVAGLAVLAVAGPGLPGALSAAGLAAAVLAALAVATELVPIRVHRRSGAEAVTLSGAFVVALLLTAQWELALAVQALASLADDAVDRTRPRTALFNVGQYSLAVGAAAGVLALTAEAGAPVPLLPALAACVAFFVLNTVLPGVLFTLEEGGPILASLLEDLPFQASVSGLVVAMAPVIAVLARVDLWLLALLLLPLLAVHRAAIGMLDSAFLSRHDPLTGLQNAGSVRERLEDHLRGLPDSGQHVAVLALALDHFDDVTHTLGPGAGNLLVRQVARRLSETAPAGAVLARTGPASFALVLPGLASPWEASACAEDLQRQFSAPYDVAESAFALRASIGLTVAPLHGTDADLLLQHAEVARAVARRARSGVEVYSPVRNDFTDRRLAVLRSLGPALRRREMAVHYQPQVDLRTGEVCGYEALLRWAHPALGQVGPDEFVPLAEHAGLMPEITDYVLDEALRQSAAWSGSGRPSTVSVNVSASVLQDTDLPARVARRLALWGVPSSRLVLELTETAVMSDPDRCRAVLSELRALGVGLSLDDYGTGYASLANLTTLPVDELKIDRSFVTDMLDDPAHRVVVRSTLDLARDLGLRVVAEGVETPAVADELAVLGCRTGQGYHYGRALAHTEVLLDRPPATVPAGVPAARRADA